MLSVWLEPRCDGYVWDVGDTVALSDEPVEMPELLAMVCGCGSECGDTCCCGGGGAAGGYPPSEKGKPMDPSTDILGGDVCMPG